MARITGCGSRSEASLFVFPYFRKSCVGNVSDVVFFNCIGLVGEGPSMNLAIVEDGVLLTPPADDILEGCTVRRAMELVTECGVLSHLGVTDARYEDIEIDRAKAAAEVML